MFTAMIAHDSGKVELRRFNTHAEARRWADNTDFFGTVSKNVGGISVPITVRIRTLSDLIDA